MQKLACLASILAVATTFGGYILELPMDSVEPYMHMFGDMTQTAVTEGERTFVRYQPLEDNEYLGGWFYNMQIRLDEANDGVPVDASVEGATLEFDVRYVQIGEGEDGSQPYDSCSFGFQMRDMENGEGWWPSNQAFNNPEPHGEWHHLSFLLADKPDMDASRLKQYELHGWYQRNQPLDYVDIDQVVITPEPSTLGLLAIGLLGVIRRR